MDTFLEHYQQRATFDPDAARATLLKMYPSLQARLEIVCADGRRILMKRPAS